MADWKIRRRHGECSRCLSTFGEGERHASVLRLDEEQNLLREDLCHGCWSTGEPETFLFWWFTKFFASRKKTVQLDLGSLERLFMELNGREEEKLRELRYLLCLLLMRKRKLKLVKVKRGKRGEELVLRRPRRDEELSVWVFDFTAERMEELRSSLQEILDGAGPLDDDSNGDAADEALATEAHGEVESEESDEDVELDLDGEGGDEGESSREPDQASKEVAR